MLGKEEKERERRRKKYKFALIDWSHWSLEDGPYSIEHKHILPHYVRVGYMRVLCDDQPYKVLKGMLKLLQEKGND